MASSWERTHINFQKAVIKATKSLLPFMDLKSTPFNPERDVARIFNSAIAAAAIGASWEVGLLDAIRGEKKVDLYKFTLQHDLDHDSMQGLVAALVVANIIERDHGTSLIKAGKLLDEAYRNKSLFHWLTLGSGGLFSRMQHVLRNENRTGTFYQRDSVAIAYACHDINKQHFDPFFWAAMGTLDFNFYTVLDLGCGSGERLMQILNHYPEASGIGIDIAGPAVEVAAAEAVKRGFGDRLSFIEGDATEMCYREEFAQVDLVTCFLMGHDFWPRENCVASLQRLQAAFPKARRLLLGDTTRVLLDCVGSQYAVKEDNVPIFTLGFEFGHAMMGVYLPTMEEWDGVFAEGGWKCLKKHLVESSYPSVIFELEHAEPAL